MKFSPTEISSKCLSFLLMTFFHLTHLNVRILRYKLFSVKNANFLIYHHNVTKFQKYIYETITLCPP